MVNKKTIKNNLSKISKTLSEITVKQNELSTDIKTVNIDLNDLKNSVNLLPDDNPQPHVFERGDRVEFIKGGNWETDVIESKQGYKYLIVETDNGAVVNEFMPSVTGLMLPVCASISSSMASSSWQGADGLIRIWRNRTWH